MKEPKDDIAETMMKLTDDDNDDDAGDDGDSDDDGDYDDDDDIWLSFTEDGQVTSKTFECLIWLVFDISFGCWTLDIICCYTRQLFVSAIYWF